MSFKPIYTKSQLAKIYSALSANADVDEKSKIDQLLETVSFIVPWYSKNITDFKNQPIDSENYEKYLKLGPHIDHTLEVIEHPDFQDDWACFLPGLNRKLRHLGSMVESDQRPRGGQTETDNRWRKKLIQKLCELYYAGTGTEPPSKSNESFDSDDEGGAPPEPTSFEAFLHLCLEPVGLEISKHLIRSGISAFRAQRNPKTSSNQR